MTLQDLQGNLAKEHERLFFDWAREIIKLSAGGLTLTVSLQNFYVHTNPSNVWLLALCWIGLGAALVCGLYVLRGQVVFYSQARDVLLDMRKLYPEKALADVLTIEPLAEIRTRYIVAYYAMMCFFAVALLGLLVFALLNLP
jgi:hypothetical protein